MSEPASQRIIWRARKVQDMTVGHGVCFYSSACRENHPPLLAFSPGYAWMRPGDAYVFYHPLRCPREPAARAAFRAAVESCLRHGNPQMGEIGGGYTVILNA